MTGPFLDNRVLCVCVQAKPWDHEQARHTARRLADQLSLPCVDAAPRDEAGYEYALTVTPQRLDLRRFGAGRDRPVAVDLLQVDISSRGGGDPRQPLARAVGCGARRRGGPLWVVDATAGFGEDAWLLASLGCRVTAMERSPIIAALLRDGLDRAKQAKPTVADRIDLIEGDTRDGLAALDASGDRPDVVYLDPMFPPKRKAALPRKAMQVLQQLVGPDEDAHLLLDKALRTACRRVVLKRPLHAATLSTTNPTMTYRGKSVRYDVYQVATPNETTRGAGAICR